jgi:Cof subfamily protein (haloacid dehalogenase superfamily)
MRYIVMKDSIKVVISDLDGTLLNARHQPSERTIKTIQALVSSGIKFWIATGRHHADAANILQKIGVNARLITANGATVSDDYGQLIKQATLEASIVKEILAIPTPQGVFQNLYQGEHWLMEQCDEVFANYYNEGDFRYTLCNFNDYLHMPINKIFYTAMNHNDLLDLHTLINKRYSHVVDTAFSMPQCLEVMPKGINKGTAILDLVKDLAISTDDIIAFGDGMNDLEMLSVVGHGHLVSNANPKLKAALPHLKSIGSHDDDSVAKTLETYFNLHIA